MDRGFIHDAALREGKSRLKLVQIGTIKTSRGRRLSSFSCAFLLLDAAEFFAYYYDK